MALAQPISTVIKVTQDDYTPMPSGLDKLNSNLCTACNTIGRKLRKADYTIKAVKQMWKNSRQNVESIDILCDLTCLTEPELMFILELSKTKEQLDKSNISMSDYWTRCPKTRDGVLSEC